MQPDVQSDVRISVPFMPSVYIPLAGIFSLVPERTTRDVEFLENKYNIVLLSGNSVLDMSLIIRYLSH